MKLHLNKTRLMAAAAASLITMNGASLADPGDFDNSGYVDRADFATFLGFFAGPNTTPGSGFEVADFDNDGDVDFSDFIRFQTMRGHTPVPIRDTIGNWLTVGSTEPYSGRQTCGGTNCHDIDAISNGFKFQQGRTDPDGNIVMQDDFFGDGRLHNRSPGMYGRFRPAAPDGTWISSKNNTSPSQMDKTAFYWMGLCASCHTGGGPGEFDQWGERLFDAATGHFGYELRGLTPQDVALDADYAYLDPADGTVSPAPWDQTGLSEPDCLFCHREQRTVAPNGTNMNWVWRTATLRARTSLVDNQGAPVPAYAAAGTAGQGWFSDLELVDPPPPLPLATRLQIDYGVGVADGSLVANGQSQVSLTGHSIARPPKDQACWWCHDRKKRGERWFTPDNVLFAKFNNLLDEIPGNDIPPEKSTACNHCHPGGLHHNFAKGNSFGMRLNDHLDMDNFRGCRECHMTEIAHGVPNPLKDPKAPDVPGDVTVHLAGRMMEVLSCQACHVPFGEVPAGVQFDNAATGTQFKFTTARFLSADPLDPTNPDKSRWYPALQWKEDTDDAMRLFPLSYMLSSWWGDWDDKGTPNDYTDDVIAPIALWRVRQITGNAPLPVVTDDNADGLPEVNRPAEIAAYIQALKGNDTYGHQVAARPVYVKGREVWHEDSAAPHGVAAIRHQRVGLRVEWATGYSLSHYVRRAADAWGGGNPPYGTCDHCHATPSPVFDRLVLVDPYGPDGQPVYDTVRNMTGVNPP